MLNPIEMVKSSILHLNMGLESLTMIALCGQVQ